MLNIRFRERTNTWPGFVDLFSNLVIILIFLLIVFVFLWTTTSVFNKSTGMKTVAELKKTNAEQTHTITQLELDEQEAKRLLILARGELETLSSDKTTLESELSNMDKTVAELRAQYNSKIVEMEKSDADMNVMISNLTAQLNQTEFDKQQMAELEQQRRELQENMSVQTARLMQQLSDLQESLDAAEEKSRLGEIQYVEMSARLNKALADKVAELNRVATFQSDFYREIKLALGERTTVQPDGDRFIVSSDILFPRGEYKLSVDGKNQLRLIANVIRDLENKIPTDVDWIIRVDGHTDKTAVLRGNASYKNNTELSFLRAQSVVTELTAAGVSPRRLVPTGFGELYPTELGNDAISLQKNRRIELQLTNK